MNQDERDVNRVAELTKLQAIKETTERLIHLDEESTHILIMVETIRKGEEIETISRVMADGDIRQILLSVGGLLKTAKEMMNSLMTLLNLQRKQEKKNCLIFFCNRLKLAQS